MNETMNQSKKYHENVVKQLKSKEERLQKIINSREPKSSAADEAYVERINNAKNFLDELQEVIAFIDPKTDIRLVSLSTLQKQVDKADFATIDFDGEYLKLALVQNFPYGNLWLLYVAPIEEL